MFVCLFVCFVCLFCLFVLFVLFVYAGTLMNKVLSTYDIGHQMEYLLATGNLRSRSGLGMQQVY